MTRMREDGTSIMWVDERALFPSAQTALAEPNGLLAASSVITASMLEVAYMKGIFPWYARGQPVLWWCPDPRMILVPEEFKLSRSLHKTLKKSAAEDGCRVTLNTAFDRVIQACAAPRDAHGGTWITPAVMNAYGGLHRRGLAQSVEVWQGEQLVGGLYGVALGRMFYGESMFARVTDASKIALAHLVAYLRANHVPLIDCQQNTRHLASLGGREIPRDHFLASLVELVCLSAVDWTAGLLSLDGRKTALEIDGR